MKARFRHRINNNEFISHNLAIKKKNSKYLRITKNYLFYLLAENKSLNFETESQNINLQI